MNQHKTNSRFLILLLAPYYASLLLIAFGAWSPDKYWWSLSLHHYLESPWRWVLLAGGVMLPLVLIPVKRLLNTRESPRDSSRSDRGYWFISLSFAVTSGILFWLFRAESHFLGDGYTVLSILASDNPVLKSREIGEALVHLWVKNLLGSGETAALLSFQLISVLAGVVFVLAVIVFSTKLFENAEQRIGLVLLTSSCGYTLLFFGYVEYYSLFVASVACYTLAGMAVARGHLRKCVLLPFLMSAVFFHILGVTLIPSAAYLLLSDSSKGRAVAKWNSPIKVGISAVILGLLGAVFYHYYTTSHFFRFAFVPFVSNRFTINDYTLFSFRHLSDVMNLLLLLVPSLILAVTVLILSRSFGQSNSRLNRYATVLILSVIGAVTLFDPKLGMPRDWDLFAFAGVPLALMLAYYVLVKLPSGYMRVAVTILALGLHFLLLIPRLAIQNNSDMAIEQFQSYISWDPLKNRNAMSMLVQYLMDQGDSARAQAQYEVFERNYREWYLNREGLAYKQEGQYQQALNTFRKVVELNPVFVAGYSNLAGTYLDLKQYDSALHYYRIARGMNPYNPKVLGGLGSTYFNLGQFEKAEQTWLTALKLDSTLTETYFGLMELYKRTGKRDKFYEFMAKAVATGDAPVTSLKQLGEYYLEQRDYDRARRVFQEALLKGLESTYWDSLKRQYPQ